MKKSRFTEVQVVQALQKHESGVAPTYTAIMAFPPLLLSLTHRGFSHSPQVPLIQNLLPSTSSLTPPSQLEIHTPSSPKSTPRVAPR